MLNEVKVLNLLTIFFVKVLVEKIYGKQLFVQQDNEVNLVVNVKKAVN